MTKITLKHRQNEEVVNMKLNCEIWQTSTAISGAVLILASLISSCVALPLASIDCDSEISESVHIPLILNTASVRSAPAETVDLEVAESSNIPVNAESNEVKGRQFARDSETSETFNSPVNAENPSETPDFDIHSQADESDSKSGFRVIMYISLNTKARNSKSVMETQKY